MLEKIDERWAVEVPDNLVARINEMHGERVGDRRVITAALADGRLAYRAVRKGEELWDRDPAEDGLDFTKPADAEAFNAQKYPWAEWCDGKWHVAFEGDDFSCTVNGFRAGLRKRATVKGLRVKISTVPGSQESVFDARKTALCFLFLAPGQAPPDWRAEREQLRPFERNRP